MNRVAAGAAVAVAIAFSVLAPACRRGSAARPEAKSETKSETKSEVTTAPKPLPEDPAAGRRSEAEWREFMSAEERERQLGFDRRRLKQHQAIVRRLHATRASFDRAKTTAAVTRARSRMAALTKELRDRMKAIDHWGVNSPMLKEYDALIAIFATAYPDARRAVIDAGQKGKGKGKGEGEGDSKDSREVLAAVRADVDLRLQRIATWLGQAAAAEDD